MINCTTVFPEYYISHTEEIMPKFRSLASIIQKYLAPYIYSFTNLIPHSHKRYRQRVDMNATDNNESYILMVRIRLTVCQIIFKHH